MHASKLMGLALAALLVSGCDNGSDDPPPPPGEVNLLADISDMDASYVTNSMFWNHFANDASAHDITVTAGTYDGMDGTVLQATSDAYGTQPWHVQLAAGDGTTYVVKVFTLKAGKQYTIRLKGAASAAANISIALQKSDDSSVTYGGDYPVALTTTTQTFTDETPFVVGAADVLAKFIINLGGITCGTIIYLDDVALLEEDAPAPTETDLLEGMNGDFEGDNTNRWAFYGTSNAQSVSDCTADGFTGDCLAFSANPWRQAAGGELWDSGLNLKNGSSADTDQTFTVVKERTYTLRFRARGSIAGMKMNAFLQHPSPWVGFLGQEITLTTSAEDYSVTGTIASSVDDAHLTGNNLGFQTGYAENAGGTIQIDDIELIEVE